MLDNIFYREFRERINFVSINAAENMKVKKVKNLDGK